MKSINIGRRSRILVFTFGITAFAQSPKADEFVLRAESSLVVLDVSVKDQAGFVSGLRPEQFKIFEDGAPQRIKQFSSGDAPATIGLVIDFSGSMAQKKSEMIEAVRAFAAASNPDDELFAVAFNDNPWLALPALVPFTNSAKVLTAALARERPTGRTALNDALEMALEHLRLGRHERKAILLISDGGDNQSHLKSADVIAGFERSSATIYAVGIYDVDDPDRNPGLLRKLALSSGGTAFFPEKLGDLEAICKGISDDIRHRYTLAFTPSESGKLHRPERKLRVVVNDATRRKLIVHTRASYILE
jgi:Ca-activated chloride channel family protein